MCPSQTLPVLCRLGVDFSSPGWDSEAAAWWLVEGGKAAGGEGWGAKCLHGMSWRVPGACEACSASAS